ncbi:MAG: lysophospholipase [Bacteroidota bacterium]|nr:lysophospholipase [Bacteroidota bacterium]
MKQFLIISILSFSFSPLFSQNIAGNWKGIIHANGNEIPIDLHFKNDNGKIDGTWDSPSQNSMGQSFSGINVKGDSVRLDVESVQGFYEGKFVGNDSIAGTWHQNGGEAPLGFSRSLENGVSKTVLSYPDEKEISITSAGGSPLYGTLLSKNNKQKLAIIIAGSGPTDREGNNPLGNKINSYEMLAHALDSQNIATFRYDKRGIAKSAVQNFKESDLVFDDYIRDAEKIYDYFHDTLGFKNIYFIGHSEGSLIAMVASQKKKVKGYISLAGAGRPIDVIIEEQINKQPLPDSVKNKIPLLFKELKEGKIVDTFPIILYPLFHKSIQPYMISWMKYSPENEIKKLNCPILILQGSCDVQIDLADAENLHKGNKKSTLDIVPLMTHTLKDAGKNCEGQQKTYTDGTLPLDKSLVNDIVNFIKA